MSSELLNEPSLPPKKGYSDIISLPQQTKKTYISRKSRWIVPPLPIPRKKKKKKKDKYGSAGGRTQDLSRVRRAW